MSAGTSAKSAKGGVFMTQDMKEVARFILGLRSAGWTEKQINDFMLYIESGEEQYMPKHEITEEN